MNFNEVSNEENPRSKFVVGLSNYVDLRNRSFQKIDQPFRLEFNYSEADNLVHIFRVGLEEVLDENKRSDALLYEVAMKEYLEKLGFNDVTPSWIRMDFDLEDVDNIKLAVLYDNYEVGTFVRAEVDSYSYIESEEILPELDPMWVRRYSGIRLDDNLQDIMFLVERCVTENFSDKELYAMQMADAFGYPEAMKKVMKQYFGDDINLDDLDLNNPF